MMQHEHEDRLLESALGLLDAESEHRVRRHLETCEECLALYREVERTIESLRSAVPQVAAEIPLFPFPARHRYSWLRVAAVLAVGFGLGFLASESLRSPAVTVVRQQIIPLPPEIKDAGFVVCEGIDLSFRLPAGGQ